MTLSMTFNDLEFNKIGGTWYTLNYLLVSTEALTVLAMSEQLVPRATNNVVQIVS